MPRLSAFYGLVLYMYIRDHGPPHLHARHGSDEGVFEIPSGVEISGSLPPRQTRLVQEWIVLHEVELIEAWNQASQGNSPGRIDPLP